MEFETIMNVTYYGDECLSLLSTLLCLMQHIHVTIVMKTINIMSTASIARRRYSTAKQYNTF